MMPFEGEPRQEYVGVNGLAGTVGVNATVEYILTNDDPNLHLSRGNDLVFLGKGSNEVDPSRVRDFARYLAERGNQGRILLHEPIKTSRCRMAVVRAIEAQRNRLRFVVDHYVTHPDTGRYLGDPVQSVRDETVEISAEKNPAEIPWGEGEHPVGHVVDATTQILTADQMRAHIRGSVTQAVKTAPAKEGKENYDFVWVAGVTDEGFRLDEHRVIAEGACTLQAFGVGVAPLFAIKDFRPRKIEFSTIHGVTGDQVVVNRFRPEDMPRGLAGDREMLRTKSGSAGDLAALVRYLALRHGTFNLLEFGREAYINALAQRTKLTSATRVPPKDSALLDLRIEVDGNFTRDELLAAYRTFAETHPETLLIEEDPIAIASSTIQGRRESGILFPSTLNVDEDGVIRVTLGYAHEDNSPNASMRISKVIADRKRQPQEALGGMV